jgi:hypothetical protein
MPPKNAQTVLFGTQSKEVPLYPNDTFEDFKQRVYNREYGWLPESLPPRAEISFHDLGEGGDCQISDNDDFFCVMNGDVPALAIGKGGTILSSSSRTSEFREGVHYKAITESGNSLYDTATEAICEFIDNSIHYTWTNRKSNKKPRDLEIATLGQGNDHFLVIWDNGHGMGESQLKQFTAYGQSKEDKGMQADVKQGLVESQTGYLSFFGVGAKQAGFFLAHSIKIVTKEPGSCAVSEIVLDEKKYETLFQNKEDPYKYLHWQSKSDATRWDDACENDRHWEERLRGDIHLMCEEKDVACEELTSWRKLRESKQWWQNEYNCETLRDVSFTYVILHLRNNQNFSTKDILKELAFTYHFHMDPTRHRQLQENQKRAAASGRGGGSRKPSGSKKASKARANTPTAAAAAAAATDNDDEMPLSKILVQNDDDDIFPVVIYTCDGGVSFERRPLKEQYKEEYAAIDAGLTYGQKPFLFTFDMDPRGVNPKLPATPRLAGWGVIFYYPIKGGDNGLEVTNPYLELCSEGAEQEDQDIDAAVCHPNSIFDCYWQQRHVPRSHVKSLPFFPTVPYKGTAKYPRNWKNRIKGKLFFRMPFPINAAKVKLKPRGDDSTSGNIENLLNSCTTEFHFCSKDAFSLATAQAHAMRMPNLLSP